MASSSKELIDVKGFEDSTGFLLHTSPMALISIGDLLNSRRDVGGKLIETTYSGDENSPSGVSRKRIECNRDYAHCACKEGSTGMVCGAINFRVVPTRGGDYGEVTHMSTYCGKSPEGLETT